MDYNLDPNMLVNALANKSDGDGILGGGGGLLGMFLLLMFGGGNGFGMNNNRNSFTGDMAVSGQIEAALAKAQAQNLSDATILNAINGNKEAISSISNALGIQTEAIRGGITNLGNGICDLGYQLSKDSASLMQEISSGNATLSRQLADCCCQTQRNIDSVRYDMASGFCATNTNIDRSIAGLEKFVDAQIGAARQETREGFNSITAQMTANKMEELQNKLQTAQIAITQNEQTQAIKDYVASYFGCPPGPATPVR